VTAVLIRPFHPRDYPALTALAARVHPDYRWSEDEIRHDDARYDGQRLALVRLVAEERGGDVVGTADAHHVPTMYHPRRLWVTLMVDPPHQGRGIGRRLYQALRETLEPLRPEVMWTGVRETHARGLRFAQDRGFYEVRRAWESRLAVASFDPTPVEPRAAQALRDIRVITAAELREQDPQWVATLYDLQTTAAADLPQPAPYTPPSLDEYRQRLVDNPNYLPDGHVLAVDGHRCVGESFVLRSQQLPDVLYQGLTAVRREYRGRGIALALKLRVIEYARRQGYREIRTWNDSLNAPMLHINTRLGFVRQAAWITLERREA
jgi:GNAT superfamily N-acetyltransferase